MNFQRYTAFTLAEVMITLGIIGIVANLTIPILMQNIKEAQTVSSLKKVYSTISSAFTLAVQEDGTPENWDLVGGWTTQGAINLINKLVPYLKVTKKCIGTAESDYKGCMAASYKYLGGNTWGDFDGDSTLQKIVLSDGSVIAVSIDDANCNSTINQIASICGTIFVDINGTKKPNQGGVDLFPFWITKTRLVPIGTQADNNYFASTCKNKLTNATTSGYGCTAWVLYNENMDYMKCSDLNWDSKLKCN